MVLPSSVLVPAAASLVALLVSPWLFRTLWRIIRYLRLARSGIHKIDRMDGVTFEAYLETLFRRLGYRVERTRHSGDFGADLVVARDGQRTVVQAKRYSKPVGVTAVQEAVAARGKYRCEAAMVVTNSTFTRPARELAEANDVELWDRGELIRRSLQRRQKEPIRREEEPVSAIRPHSPDYCAECGATVSARDRRHCLNHSGRFRGRVYCYQHMPRA